MNPLHLAAMARSRDSSTRCKRCGKAQKTFGGRIVHPHCRNCGAFINTGRSASHKSSVGRRKS